MATKCMSCGGSTKKMKAGGTSSKVMQTGGEPKKIPSMTNSELRKIRKEVKKDAKNYLREAKTKMQKGGSTAKVTLPMMGMPMYSSNPRSEQGRILKNGGSTTSRAVTPGCRGGMVKDASGKCVMERKFKAGGSLKPVPTDKVGLAKLPTTVRNKMGFQKKGGAVKKK